MDVPSPNFIHTWDAAMIRAANPKPDPMVSSLQRARRYIQDELKIIVVKHDLSYPQVTLISHHLLSAMQSLDCALVELTKEN